MFRFMLIVLAVLLSACTEAPGLSLLRSGESETVFEAGSGTYRFTFPAP